MTGDFNSDFSTDFAQANEVIVGSSSNLLSRLKSLLPSRWFSYTAPLRDAVLGGIGDSLANAYSLIVYAATQTRLATATGFWLDLAAYDFFGLRVQRLPNELDAVFSQTIRNEIFRRRVTRQNIAKAVTDLTGNGVTILEPWNANDTGGFGKTWALNEPTSFIGSSGLPFTMFITIVNPYGSGVPNMSGLNNTQSGFGTSYFGLSDAALITGTVTSQNIYDTINANRAAGVTCWARIIPVPPTYYRIGSTFAIGVSPLN
jgi:hypothetical protein